MNIGNITNTGMNLNENGKIMQIEIYEQQINQLTNNWNELEEFIKNKFLDYSNNTRKLDEDTLLYCLHKKDTYREILNKIKEIKEKSNGN